MSIKILIFPSGLCSGGDGAYTDYGSGHVVRCLNLARELLQQDPHVQITLAVSGPESLIAKRLARVPVSLVEVPTITTSSSVWQSSHRLRFETNLVRFVEPEAVVSDTHPEALVAAKHSSVKCASILDLPPILYFHVYSMLADLVIVPLLESAQPLPAPLVSRAETVTYVGPMLDATSLNEAAEQPMEQLRQEIGIPGRFILVYLSRISRDRPRFVQALLQAYDSLLTKESGIQLVLVGPGAQTIETKPNDGLIKLEFVESLHKYMRASAAFITRSPISAMESLLLGTQPVIIPIPEDHNQSAMGRSLAQRSARYMSLNELAPDALAGMLLEQLAHAPFASAKPTVGGTAGAVLAAQKILELARTT